jgi:hypothetical protein
VQKKYLIALSGVIVVLAVLVLALTQVRSVRSSPQIPTPTPTYALTPIDPTLLPFMPTAIQPEVVDLAPNIPYDDKPSVVVQHPDGSRTMFLVAPDLLDAFLQNLPAEDIVKLVLAPPSMLGAGEPPTPEPPSPEPVTSEPQ